jgi:hypothetical protein
MKKAPLKEFRLFFTTDKLEIGEIQVPLKPECANVTVEVLNCVKELERPLIFCLLRKVQEFKSTQITVARHILVGPNTLFLS